MKSLSLAAALAALLALPAVAHDGVHIVDPYARSMGMNAKTGAAFMVIENHQAEDDRLIEARSDVAERVELHTHLIDANGVARMVEVKDGFAIPANGSHALERGADHVMFLGIKEPFVDGEAIPVTLVFERAGEVQVEIPVDLSRIPAQGGGMGHRHGAMQHGSGG